MTFFNREFSQGSQLDKIKRQLILYNCHDILQLQLKMKTIFTLFNVASIYYVRYPLREEFCCFFDWSLQSINSRAGPVLPETEKPKVLTQISENRNRHRTEIWKDLKPRENRNRIWKPRVTEMCIIWQISMKFT